MLILVYLIISVAKVKVTIMYFFNSLDNTLSICTNFHIALNGKILNLLSSFSSSVKSKTNHKIGKPSKNKKALTGDICQNGGPRVRSEG